MSPLEFVFRTRAKHLDYARILSGAVCGVFVVCSVAEVWRQSALSAVVYAAFAACSGFSAWAAHAVHNTLINLAESHAEGDRLLRAINQAVREREGERVSYDRKDVN